MLATTNQPSEKICELRFLVLQGTQLLNSTLYTLAQCFKLVRRQCYLTWTSIKWRRKHGPRVWLIILVCVVGFIVWQTALVFTSWLVFLPSVLAAASVQGNYVQHVLDYEIMYFQIYISKETWFVELPKKEHVKAGKEQCWYKIETPGFSFALISSKHYKYTMQFF